MPNVKPRGTRLGAPNKSNPLTANGVSFTQFELDVIKEYVDIGYPNGMHSTLHRIVGKIRKAKPEWSPNYPTRNCIFKFAYAEGICKL